MKSTVPNHALQRFDGLGQPGEGFAEGKGLANSQTERVAHASQLLPGLRALVAIHASRGLCPSGKTRSAPAARRFLAPRMNGQFTILLQPAQPAASHLKP